MKVASKLNWQFFYANPGISYGSLIGIVHNLSIPRLYSFYFTLFMCLMLFHKWRHSHTGIHLFDFSIVRFHISELPGVALIILVWFGDLQQLLWPFSMGWVKIFKNLVLQTRSDASQPQELLSEIPKPRWSYTMEAKHHRLFKQLVHMVTWKDLNRENEK